MFLTIARITNTLTTKYTKPQELTAGRKLLRPGIWGKGSETGEGGRDKTPATAASKSRHKAY